MKISKEKNRALMKEFGTVDIGVSTEDLVKRRDAIRVLIKLGKARGYLTQVEITDHLPDMLVDDDTMGSAIATLNDLGIAVR